MPAIALLPILLALSAAALFGVSVVVAQMGLREVGSRAGSLLSIGSTAVFFWILFPFFFREVDWNPSVLLPFAALFAVAGIFTPGISLVLAFEANRRLGATISGTLASTSPLFAVSIAVLALGEQPSLKILLGTAGIVTGVMAISWRGAGSGSWPFWAILFPLGAAFLRGLMNIVTKFGMGLAAAPFTAALISFSAAFAWVALSHGIRGVPLDRGQVRKAWRYFLWTGVLNGLGLLCMNAALVSGRVVVVSPVVATFPLFTLALSLMLRMERFGPRVILGVILVVGGVVAVMAFR